MNMLQAHGRTTHKLTKNTAAQCQPQGSHNYMIAANAMETVHQTLKQTLIDDQDTDKQLQKNATDQKAPGHKLYKFVRLYQTLQNTPKRSTNANKRPRH